MAGVVFERAGRGLRIHPCGWMPLAGRDEEAWKALPQTDVLRVCHVLREFVLGDQDCRRLRELVDGVAGMATPSLLNQEQLIEAVAQLVSARRLLMQEKARLADPTATQRPTLAASGKQAASDAVVWTPARLRQAPVAQDMPRTPETPAAPQPPAEDGFASGLDQDTQAAVLKAASLAGMPFCEVCHAGSQARASLAASASISH